ARPPPMRDVPGFSHGFEDNLAGSVEFANHEDFGIGRQGDRQAVLSDFRHISPFSSFWTGVRPDNHRAGQSFVPRTGDSLRPTTPPLSEAELRAGRDAIVPGGSVRSGRRAGEL